jgi:hypothetical protein
LKTHESAVYLSFTMSSSGMLMAARFFERDATGHTHRVETSPEIATIHVKANESPQSSRSPSTPVAPFSTRLLNRYQLAEELTSSQ